MLSNILALFSGRHRLSRHHMKTWLTVWTRLCLGLCHVSFLKSIRNIPRRHSRILEWECSFIYQCVWLLIILLRSETSLQVFSKRFGYWRRFGFLSMLVSTVLAIFQSVAWIFWQRMQVFIVLLKFLSFVCFGFLLWFFLFVEHKKQFSNARSWGCFTQCKAA